MLELHINHQEISADKVYGTTDNRAYLKDNEITSNIAFYKESEKENTCFGIKDFEISEDINFVTCPNGLVSTDFKIINEKERLFKQFKFKSANCDNCKLRNQCLYKSKDGKFCRKSKDVKIPLRYDSVLNEFDISVKKPEIVSRFLGNFTFKTARYVIMKLS